MTAPRSTEFRVTRRCYIISMPQAPSRKDFRRRKGVTYSHLSRVSASRPEVVRQEFCAFSSKFWSSGEPRFLSALRYVDSS